MFRILLCLPLALTLQIALAVSAEWAFVDGESHDVEIKRTDDALVIKTTGADPYLVGQLSQPIHENDSMLELEYFCPDGIRSPSVYYGPPIRAAHRVSLPRMPVAEGWSSYTADLQDILGKPLPLTTQQIRLDLGDKPNVQISIRALRLRPKSPAEIKSAEDRQTRIRRKQEQAAQITDYLNHVHDATIQSVTVDQTQVIVVAKRSANDVQLFELRPHQSLLEPGTAIAIKPTSVGDNMTWQIPRRDNSFDRVQSAWRIRPRGTKNEVSARNYPTSIRSASQAERLVPRNQKGVTGLSTRGPLQDFADLDVTAASINLVLPRFVSDRPAPNHERIPATGEPVYFNTAGFRHYDPLLKFARKHDIVISAIVLIPTPKKDNAKHPLVHPENDSGVYAMPDMTTPRGAAVYSFVLDKIASHYKNAPDSPGVITNWIAHNEVDFHTMWTNMGRQPREVLTETYYRSMRVIYNAARTHSADARVFASLTHHWNVTKDETNDWNQLSPREFLTTLQRYSQLEGDFEWGVAYHPYPQSLFAKVAWEDKQITNDFDSPLVTIQNLEVLGRFLRQPDMHYHGKLRGVLLSEQGFHTHGYDASGQNQQAGSLLWAMNRVRQMPWVESFLYHRWIDHPAEGGLLLGLRTLPTKKHPHGEKKRSWHLYQAIGTDQEAEAAKGLPHP